MQKESVHIQKNSSPKTISIPLASSKSESNRVLIMKELAGEKAVLHNLSSARDTQIMKKLLSSDDEELSVLDAGTVMRFMTGFLTLSKKERILTGTDRMCQRPIGLLVDALNQIGSDIKYVGNEGFPPLKIKGTGIQKTNKLEIPGNISSQYISALLMIAPELPQGLEISLCGEVYSLPYIKMTLSLMSRFGISHSFSGNTISIAPQKYQAAEYTVESDWSGASYWYSIVALSENASIKLLGLRKHSYQGDSAIVEIMEQLGVKSEFEDDGVLLTKIDAEEHLDYDFRNCPDLAQTIFTVGAAKGISMEMTGLESLKIKESDRTAAMSTELAKIGASLFEKDDKTWKLTVDKDFQVESSLVFDTYDDHRMAMALAPLATRFDISIKEPEVVKKSYPEYWQHLELAGFKLS
ncbi:MAG: 3-phosphoshikimate 1-carboxyvinyltransferase [Cyclobacteriaceae bacterium]